MDQREELWNRIQEHLKDKCISPIATYNYQITLQVMGVIDKFIAESEQSEPGGVDPDREIKIGDTVALRWDIDERSNTHEYCGITEYMKTEGDDIIGEVMDVNEDTENGNSVRVKHNDALGEFWWYHTHDLYIVDE